MAALSVDDQKVLEPELEPGEVAGRCRHFHVAGEEHDRVLHPLEKVPAHGPVTAENLALFL